MCSVSRRHAPEEIQHEDSDELGQECPVEAVIFGRELIEAQAVFE